MNRHSTAPIDDQQIDNLYHQPRNKAMSTTYLSSKPKKPNKPNPDAPKITPPCTECGRKFWSWKALFGHMRCHPERQWRGINPPPNLRPPESFMTEEDHQVATCLLMLANGPTADAALPHQCSSCNKVFASHQALGGHRASHKNVKGCSAITRNEDEGVSVITDNIWGRSEEHGICFRVFSSGQALGSDKRCHREKGDDRLAPGSGCGLDLNLPPNIHGESSLSLDLRLGL